MQFFVHTLLACVNRRDIHIYTYIYSVYECICGDTFACLCMCASVFFVSALHVCLHLLLHMCMVVGVWSLFVLCVCVCWMLALFRKLHNCPDVFALLFVGVARVCMYLLLPMCVHVLAV